MTEELQSFLLGTIPLDLMLVLALRLTVVRGAASPNTVLRRSAMWTAGMALAIQGLHFAEEWATGFNCRFPELLGLHPWSIELWATFNLVWIGIWLLSLYGLRIGMRAALFPLWFLGIAGAVNLVAHPLLALAEGGYFPGLWTAPLCGLSGGLLLRGLTSLTDDRSSGGTGGIT